MASRPARRKSLRTNQIASRAVHPAHRNRPRTRSQASALHSVPDRGRFLDRGIRAIGVSHAATRVRVAARGVAWDRMERRQVRHAVRDGETVVASTYAGARSASEGAQPPSCARPGPGRPGSRRVQGDSRSSTCAALAGAGGEGMDLGVAGSLPIGRAGTEWFEVRNAR